MSPPRLPVLAAAATLLVAAAAALFPTLSASGATPACSVTYAVTGQWDSGFQGAVTITNNAAAMSSWTLSFGFPGTQKVTQGWNGKWSQSGTTVTATNESYNGTLATGASVSAGFLASWSGSNPAPTTFTLNGTTCNVDSGPSPTPTPTPTSTPTGPPTDPGPASAIHASGNKLVDAAGKERHLYGVNRSGAEFMCVQGYGVFDGPVDDASIAAIADWKVNTVRVPLNEECWLGTSNIDPAYAGTNYINAIKGFVTRLEAHGITPLLEMHWSYGQYTGNSSGCSDIHASCQKPMPDAQYAPAFWKSVAGTFKDDPAVAFDLFNEPYPDRATSTLDQAWACWRDGGTCPGIGYEVAGMQDLLDAVRGTGAQNLVLVPGIAYANDLRQWLAHKPTDPAGNLAAAWHSYNFNTCSSASCWDQQLAPVAAQVPFVAGEIGENTCAHSYTDQVMAWLDAHDASYLGWTWNTWDCASGPSLISNYDGTPTAYGTGLRDHLRALS
ncbi:cellulose binding domain-containing protein [Streptomyces beijiangensis]|uniref:Endoglucanase n=1 Tax=Streptomyces beijiangensis TaxID=163361 RepID=A0A939JHH3_9ACTN|nr:cellulose binding domain-containing protein [Streptomyces beijiangensis]MBO0516241.1 cellulase family glycosylhydrolase [Streptomyces beijiangensis]